MNKTLTGYSIPVVSSEIICMQVTLCGLRISFYILRIWKGWKELEGGQEKKYVIEFLFQNKNKNHQNYS